MFIFGGVHNGVYFDELHSINIDDGSITKIITHDYDNSKPCPRAGATMFCDGRNLIVWGGFDGVTHNAIHKLNLETLVWEKHEQPNISGRTAAAHCEFNGRHYIYGSSKMPGILVYDEIKNSFEHIATKGAEPPTELTRAKMVAADEFIFLIGGENPATFMHIYALEVSQKWWSAFHIRPDFEELSIEDGIVNSTGLFMLPREYGSSLVYEEEKRTLISTLGSRLVMSVPIYELDIGSALGFLHMRSDMREALFASQM